MELKDFNKSLDNLTSSCLFFVGVFLKTLPRRPFHLTKHSNGPYMVDLAPFRYLRESRDALVAAEACRDVSIPQGAKFL
jgi:hypothetical protein